MITNNGASCVLLSVRLYLYLLSVRSLLVAKFHRAKDVKLAKRYIQRSFYQTLKDDTGRHVEL